MEDGSVNQEADGKRNLSILKMEAMLFPPKVNQKEGKAVNPILMFRKIQRMIY
jgi:hypothetical protein